MAKKISKAQKFKWSSAGGIVGGRRRALALSPERRKEIAKAAAAARWAK
jgi:hypothetical protein